MHETTPRQPDDGQYHEAPDERQAAQRYGYGDAEATAERDEEIDRAAMYRAQMQRDAAWHDRQRGQYGSLYAPTMPDTHMGRPVVNIELPETVDTEDKQS